MEEIPVAQDKRQRRRDRAEAKKKRAAATSVEKRLTSGAELDLKVVLVGSGGVGKTSLLARFLDETANIRPVQPTVLCEFGHCILRLGGRTVQLRLWDTGGMERFEAMSSAAKLFRGAHGVMLVFSVTDLASFNALPGWLGRARQSIGSDSQFDCCLVGNKADGPETRRLVSPREAQLLANQLAQPYIETSALTVANVQKAFVDLTLAIMRRLDVESSATTADSGTRKLERRTGRDKASCVCS